MRDNPNARVVFFDTGHFALETHGEEKLSARVEALYRSKVETEQRIAAIVAHFAKLDTIRKEVNDLFVKLNGTLDRLS